MTNDDESRQELRLLHLEDSPDDATPRQAGASDQRAGRADRAGRDRATPTPGLRVVQSPEGRTGVRLIVDVDGRESPRWRRRCGTASPPGAGMGMGLGGARRLTDHFEVRTAKGEDTTLTRRQVVGMTHRSPPELPPAGSVVEVVSASDVAHTRRAAQAVAAGLGFPGDDQARVALVVTEMATKLVKYVGFVSKTGLDLGALTTVRVGAGAPA